MAHKDTEGVMKNEFSLLEFLLVAAIIGVVSAMAMPRLTDSLRWADQGASAASSR